MVELIMNEGNPKIRALERYTRNTLDLGAVVAIKKLTHLPVIVAPSHATGHREMVVTILLDFIITGCDGLEIEVHLYPEEALSDKEQ